MDWQSKLLAIPGILLGLTVHECCHALCALKLGDTTARDQGRITLNPVKHIDIIGFLFLIIAGFGWAKPVQFDPSRLSNYRRDKALIAAAGPASNLLLGIILMFIIKALFFYFGGRILINHFAMMIFQAAVINFGLCIFNLIPIPPLDGSHIVFSGLNLNQETEQRIMRIGMPFLFIILIIQSYANIPILPIGKLVSLIITFIIQL